MTKYTHALRCEKGTYLRNEDVLFRISYCGCGHGGPERRVGNQVGFFFGVSVPILLPTTLTTPMF